MKSGKSENVKTVLKIIKNSAVRAGVKSGLTLAVALLKGEKFDLVVQKAVELGVTKLIPIQTKRADVKLKDGEKKLERWRKIALEAAKQSGRAGLMKIETLLNFEKFIETAEETKILFAERGEEEYTKKKKKKKITAVIGSEGGWEDSEIEAARRNNFQIIPFGGRILRRKRRQSRLQAFCSTVSVI